MNRNRFVVVISLLVMVFVFMWHIGSEERTAQAQGIPAIPKAWGSCKGAAGVSLIFEDSAGTIRLVNARDGQLHTTFQRN